MTFLGMVGSAISKDFQTLLACRIIVAAGGSSTEALGAAIINVSSTFDARYYVNQKLTPSAGHILPS